MTASSAFRLILAWPSRELFWVEALKAMVGNSSRMYFTQAWGEGNSQQGKQETGAGHLDPGLEGVLVPQLAVLVLRAADQQQQLPHLPEGKRMSG